MNLAAVFKQVQPSIVAFIQRHAPRRGEMPYPPIVGTGFIVNRDGLIATNGHVVKTLQKLANHSLVPEGDVGAGVIFFHKTESKMRFLPLPITGVGLIDSFRVVGHYHGPSKPDVGIVRVNARDLPALEIAEDFEALEGLHVATAGFPMGTDCLAAPGYLHQFTPTLQSGIISSVLPMACRRPHSFTINVMTQGGASGSPVFEADTGRVVGILYGGLVDFDELERGERYKVPTSISYVVPWFFLREVLEKVDDTEYLELPEDSRTLTEILSEDPEVLTEPIREWSEVRR